MSFGLDGDNLWYLLTQMVMAWHWSGLLGGSCTQPNCKGRDIAKVLTYLGEGGWRELHKPWQWSFHIFTKSDSETWIVIRKSKNTRRVCTKGLMPDVHTYLSKHLPISTFSSLSSHPTTGDIHSSIQPSTYPIFATVTYSPSHSTVSTFIYLSSHPSISRFIHPRRYSTIGVVIHPSSMQFHCQTAFDQWADTLISRNFCMEKAVLAAAQSC